MSKEQAKAAYHLHHPDGRRIVFRPTGERVTVEKWRPDGWLMSRYSLPLAIARSDYGTARFLGFRKW